jgi:uncharacterized protein YjdB
MAAAFRPMAGLALGAAMLLLACSDTSGPNQPKVASLQLTGLPEDTVAVGLTVQLQATPLDAGGQPVPNVTVGWASNDTTVATVSQTGLVTTRAPGSAGITATTGSVVAAGTFTVGSLRTATVQITGAPDGPLAPGDTVRLVALTFARTGSLLTDRPVTWSSSQPAVASVSSTGLVLAHADGTAEIMASSDWATDAVPVAVVDVVASVQVTPSTFPLYQGQSRQLTATPLNAAGAILAGRSVTWTSAAPDRATVDSAGVVTALSPGGATIRATVDEVVGLAATTVLARPVADWSGATEWVTHQGNARHTGHVPVTADPVTFAEAWTVTPVPGAVLNPPAEGGGSIFVTTRGDQLAALDAATGARLWSYDFGSIASTHPPAFGNGRVYVTTGGHGDSFLWAFDATAGSVAFRSAYANQWSTYFAPVVLDGVVYMAGGYHGGMYAFDAADGEERWFFKTNQYDDWTPAGADGAVYAYTGSYSPRVDVVDAATGEELYSIPDPSFGWSGWSMNISPALGSMDNLLATQNNRLVSFDLQGRSVGWQRPGGFTGNVTVADGHLYVVNHGQVEARAESDGALQWVWVPPAGKVDSNLIAVNNLLFVSTGAATHAIDLASGLQVWTHPAGGHLALTRDGLLLIVTNDARVTAIRLRTP